MSNAKNMARIFVIFLSSFFIATNVTAYNDIAAVEVVTNFKQLYAALTLYDYQGHPAVTQSLVEGLKQLGVDFNVNPDVKKIHKAVFVLAGTAYLRKMIKLKKSGDIKILFSGPNLVGSPQREQGIIFSSAIDKHLVNSQWTYNAYRKVALSRNRDHISIWYAGVDEQFWQPSTQEKQRDVLVYWKTEPQSFCDSVCDVLRRYNWNPHVIKYGSYERNTFKKELNRAAFSIFLSVTESQGIALAESWSMDVPTIVWNPEIDLTYLGCTYKKTSACPYLTAHTGLTWKTFEDLDRIIKNIDVTAFKPREWILQNMTNRIAALQLLKLMVDSAQNSK